MVWTRLEEALWDAARVELPSWALEMKTLAPAIVARSHRYTDERETLDAPLAGRAREADLAARALFFSVADAAKIELPIAELDARGLLAEKLRVLDVGAGAGAMTLGLIAARPGRVSSVTAIDRDAPALALLRRAAAVFAPEVRLEVRAADVERLPDGPFDLVLAGSVLNELSEPRAAALCRELLARTGPRGAVVIVEPALRDTTRALHRLRDRLVAAGDAHVFAPCTRQGPCPALDDERDWCHEDRPFRPPPRLHSLMTRTGLRGATLKFAYLTLRRQDDPLVVVPAGRRALRVVSGTLDSKGTVERLVCGPRGRARLRFLTRARTDALRTLSASRRGDVLLEGDDGVLEPSDQAD